MPITIKVVSSNPAHGEMYSIQHYMIMCVSDLRQVDQWFSLGTPISSTNKSDDIAEILLKVALNTITIPTSNDTECLLPWPLQHENWLIHVTVINFFKFKWLSSLRETETLCYYTCYIKQTPNCFSLLKLFFMYEVQVAL